MSGGESTCHFEEQGKPSIAGRCNKNTSLQKATPPLPLDKLSRELTQWHGVRCPKHCRPSSSSLSAQSSACSVPSGTEIKLHYLSPPKVLISLCVAVCVSMTIVMTVCCTFLSCILERSPWSWEHCLILEGKQAS